MIHLHFMRDTDMYEIQYVDVEMTKSEFVRKYGEYLPTFEDKYLFNKVNPLDALNDNDIVIVRKQK